jgi:hypothetical protein
MISDEKMREQPVRSIMQKPFRYVDIETPVKLLAGMITPESPAVLVRDFPANQPRTSSPATTCSRRSDHGVAAAHHRISTKR